MFPKNMFKIKDGEDPKIKVYTNGKNDLMRCIFRNLFNHQQFINNHHQQSTSTIINIFNTRQKILNASTRLLPELQ